MADAQRTRRRALLHARGGVHGRAHGGVVRLDAGAERHVAGVHAHAHGEVWETVLALRRFGLLASGRQDGQPGTHGALGIVLTRLVHAEGRFDAIAGETQHPALVGFDDGRHAPQRTAEHAQRGFSVHGVGHGGGADDVGKQHRHLPALHTGRAQQAGQAGMKRGGGQRKHRITQRGALRNERRDGGAQVFDVLVVHGMLRFAASRGRSARER